MRRYGTAEDIGGRPILGGNAAAFLTGHTHLVDGG